MIFVTKINDINPEGVYFKKFIILIITMLS